MKKKLAAFLAMMMTLVTMSSAAMAEEEKPTITAHKANAITIDGDLSDWDLSSQAVLEDAPQIIRGLSFWQVQLLSSLMLFLSNALPNVAGMGSIETAFLLVFGSFMTRGEAMSTLMLFRIASYYFVFGFSAVASLFAQKHLDRMDAQK